MKTKIIAFVTFAFVATAHADHDPVALHDRGNQKLIGDLEVTGQIKSSQIRADGVISAKSLESDGQLTAVNGITTKGALIAAAATVSGVIIGGEVKAKSIAATGHASALSLSISLPSCCDYGFICASGYQASLAYKVELIKLLRDATGLSLQEAKAFIESGSDGDFGCGITFRAPLSGYSCREILKTSEGGEETFISCPFCSSTDQIGRISYTESALLLCVADATASNGVKKLTFTPATQAQ